MPHTADGTRLGIRSAFPARSGRLSQRKRLPALTWARLTAAITTRVSWGK